MDFGVGSESLGAGESAASAGDPRVWFFVRRLARLLALRRMVRTDPSLTIGRLLDHVIYSTYLDLRALGREEDARSLLQGKPLLQ